MSMSVEKRQEVERKVVRHLIREMKKAGWEIAHVDDGGDQIKNPNETQAMDAVFSVDESWIRFKCGSMQRTVFIVLGNDGWDCICDYATSDPGNPEDDFEKVMKEQVDPYTDKLSEEC